MCSICFSKSARRDILDDDLYIEKHRITYAEVIKFCLCLQISNEPGANTKMCDKCIKKLTSYYKFKKLAVQSNSFMKFFCKDEDKKNNDLIKQEVEIEYNTEPEIFNVFDRCESLECEKKIKNTDHVIKNEGKLDYDTVWINKQGKIENSVGTDIEPTNNNHVKKVIKAKKMQICEECGKSVINLKKHMDMHKQSKSSDKHKFKCSECNLNFFTNNGKKRHVKRIHLGIKETCKICFKEVTVLKAHLATVHNKSQLKHECSVCNKKCLSLSVLKLHMTTHSNERHFECDQCNSKFKSMNILTKHKQNVHYKERSHLCQYCSKTFYRRNHLLIHLRTHTNERPYVCECGKAYKTSSVLAQHRLSHTGEKNYVCDYCHMAFAVRYRLQVHILTHTKEKAYPCRFCNMRFIRSDHRNRHEKTAHSQHLPAP